jgi:DNA-binding MarR family transcriptional regulator
MNNEMTICKKPCHATEGNERGEHPKCMSAPKLSDAQRAFLVAFGERATRWFADDSSVGRHAAVVAAAWWRTANALERRGLIRRHRNIRGDLSQAVDITDAGRAALRGES